MDVRFLGTGGISGWPQPGCRCASCMRAATAGPARRPGAVLVDGRLVIAPGRPPRLEVPDGAEAGEEAEAGAGAADPAEAGYRITRLAGGWDICGPDDSRLLVAAGPGEVPGTPVPAEPGDVTGIFPVKECFDIILLDLLHSPAQLGALRARGLVGQDTIVAALYADHRVGSERELARRARFWRAVLPADGDTLSTGHGAAAGAGVRPHRTLILGGARSGKSREAELRLAAEPRVTYLAAGPWPNDSWTGADGRPDPEWAARVAAHQARRPAWWQTLEGTDVAGALRRLDGAVLIDGIGTWLAAVLDESGAWETDAGSPTDAASPRSTASPASAASPAARAAARIDDLVAAWRETSALVVAVTDQVGSGIVPATPAGRQFRDQLGWLNQRLAAESEETVLVVAGRPVSLPT